MRITIVAVGKLKEPHFRDAAKEYLKRLKPYATVEIVDVPDRDVTRDETRAIAEEGKGVLKALPDDAYVIVLDIEGKQLSSEQFADRIGDLGLQGRSRIAFVIGGAAGLSADVLARADERISFGKITLPHQMARIVLLEQVYRAFRIMRGEPYHR